MSGASLLKVAEAGAGALTTKSIGLEPRTGYANPTVVELEHGLLNAMGLPGPGVDEYGGEIKIALEAEVPVIGSIFGATPEEFEQVANRMEAYGVNALELNVSCPHAERYGMQVGGDPEMVKQITDAVKRSVEVPVFVKLTPNVTDIVSIAKAVEEAGGDAVVAINTVKAMNIDLLTAMPVLSNRTGGYSGPAIKPIGVRCVYEIAAEVNVPIIGVGGILNGEDAVEYLLAGASAVQLGSAVFYRGIEVFATVCNEIEAFMEAQGYTKITDLIGLAQKA